MCLYLDKQLFSVLEVAGVLVKQGWKPVYSPNSTAICMCCLMLLLSIKNTWAILFAVATYCDLTKNVHKIKHEIRRISVTLNGRK